MGYYSRFEIEVEDRRPTPDEILEELREENDNADYVHREGRGKWYEWIEDVKEFSRRHPGLLFKVRREGEEAGDIEVGYFLDGKHQGGRAELRLPEFKEPTDEQ